MARGFRERSNKSKHRGDGTTHPHRGTALQSRNTFARLDSAEYDSESYVSRSAQLRHRPGLERASHRQIDLHLSTVALVHFQNAHSLP